MARPRQDYVVDIHCVTRWSKIGARFSGIPLHDLLEEAGVTEDACYVSFVARSERNHSTSLPLRTLIDLQAIVAFEYEGEPLEEVHGGPVRVVVPGKYFYKSVKWLERIDVLTFDKLGYWEGDAGYHNNADPWTEE
eukprot:6981712-Pyramimonas_sp.AAC.1